MRWAFLALAIVCEVSATLALRQATVTGRRRWRVVVGVGYLAAFTLLCLTLATGVPLGVAYGTWAACGVALTALASHVLFDEPLTPTMWAGIGCIVAGVALIEVGAGRAH